MNEKTISRWIFIISVAVPLLVAVLFFTPALQLQIDVSFLPKLNAIINSLVSILLVTGLYFIKNKNRRAHRFCMLSAFSLSALFLISYVVYHSAAADTKYGGVGFIRYVYFFILITHILLATIILPFILVTVSRALTERFDKHRKIARITFPMWLYVSVTGVIVYLMISPYYK
jgi:putative membrane protein